MSLAVAECRMVLGGVESSREASRTDRHATDSGGRIDAIRTVAEADGRAPSRELTAAQRTLTAHQRGSPYGIGLIVESACSAPDMFAVGLPLAARGSEPMASGWRAGSRRTIRHSLARSEFVRTVADSYHQGWVDDPALGGTNRYRLA